MTMKADVLKEFQTIPGVGKSVAGDFWNLGLRKIADLKRQDPQKLYDALCKFQGGKGDRCMLYVMRCAVYFASTKQPKPDLLKWWNWKDRK
jgi:Pathogenicity locus